MPDYGARVANHAIITIDRKLRRTYKKAQQELEKKLATFTARHKAKDTIKRQQLAEKKISLADYQNWLTGQVFIRGQWESKIKEVTEVLLNHNKEAASIVHEHKLDVFAENYNYEAFKTETQFGQVDTGMGISFDVYNAQAVERLVEHNPQILPRWRVDEEKDYAWNYKKVNNLVKQGIIQGESIDQIAKRLCSDLSAQNENKMRTFARTAITGAQNAGRQQQMNDAADLGLDVHKQWLATLDTRTRDAHRHLDGQEVPYNEPFESDLGDIEYPGDPSAEPANVYNCRCTMVSIYPKYEDRSKQSWRETETVDGQSYVEWKEGKLDGSQNLIDEIDDYYDKDVTVSKESRSMVNEALENIFSNCSVLRKHIRNVVYTHVNGIGASSLNGRTISLDKRAFSTPETIKTTFMQLVSSGHSVNVNNPMFMVAHEAGHSLESYIVTHRTGLANANISTLQKDIIENERKKLGVQYFLHMGFKDETTEEIYDIIKNELGERAISDPSELAAQAFAQVLYGTKPAPHAKSLVNWLISLAEGFR